MQLNATTDYAIRIIVYLASMKDKVTSNEIAMAMKIPQKYIAGIITKLKSSGYIKTHLGAGGGYSLNCDPSAITLCDIVQKMEGGIKIKRCTDCDINCVLYGEDDCTLTSAYSEIHSLINDAFTSITISDLINQYGSFGFEPLAENNVCSSKLQ